MVNAVRGAALLLALAAVAFGPAAYGAEAVVDRDAAIRIAKASCGGALNLPADDHPRWEAQQAGDHWSAHLLSDYAPYFENALMVVDVAADGTTSDCIVYAHP